MDHLYYEATVAILAIFSEQPENGAQYPCGLLEDLPEPTMVHQQ